MKETNKMSIVTRKGRIIHCLNPYAAEKVVLSSWLLSLFIFCKRNKFLNSRNYYFDTSGHVDIGEEGKKILDRELMIVDVIGSRLGTIYLSKPGSDRDCEDWNMYSSCANSGKKQLYKLIYSADRPSSCNLTVSNGVKGTATTARIKKKRVFVNRVSIRNSING